MKMTVSILRSMASIGGSLALVVLPVSTFVDAKICQRNETQNGIDPALTQDRQVDSKKSDPAPDPVPENAADSPSLDLAETNAADAYAKISLLEIENLALANNPSLAAASAALAQADALRQQIGVRPNPSVGYFGMQIADQGTDQHGLFVEQEFIRGQKLELNRAVLEKTVAAQQSEIQVQRLRVLTDVRLRFFQAAAAEQQWQATQKFAQVARKGVQIATDRQQAEEATLVEVLQARTLLSEVELATQQFEFQYQAAWKELAATVGIPLAEAQALDVDFNHLDFSQPESNRTDASSNLSFTDPPDTSSDWQLRLQQIIQRSPELQVAQARVCEKLANVQRQRAQAIPNLTAQLGAGFDNGTDSGMINVQISRPIMVNNRNEGNIAAAQAEYMTALAEVKRIEMSLRSRWAQTSRALQVAQAAVDRYQNEIIPQAEETLDLSETAYKAGELDFLQVLVVRRTYYDASLKLIQAQAQLAQAKASEAGALLSGGLEIVPAYATGDGLRSQSFGGQ